MTELSVAYQAHSIDTQNKVIKSIKCQSIYIEIKSIMVRGVCECPIYYYYRFGRTTEGVGIEQQSRIRTSELYYIERFSWNTHVNT